MRYNLFQIKSCYAGLFSFPIILNFCSRLSPVGAISESRPSLKCPENLKTEWLCVMRGYLVLRIIS